ncbi:MAG: ABC transporter, partial [Pseudonocardiales bacterium]
MRQRHDVRRRISLTGQYAALDGAQTGTENLTMMGRLLHLPARDVRARVRQLLAEFDLADAA